MCSLNLPLLNPQHLIIIRHHNLNDIIILVSIVVGDNKVLFGFLLVLLLYVFHEEGGALLGLKGFSRVVVCELVLLGEMELVFVVLHLWINLP